MNTIKIKAFVQILLLVAFGVIVNIWLIPGVLTISLILFLSAFALFFGITSFKVYHLKKYEEDTYAKISFDKTKMICITTACKNEGNTIIQTVKHYLNISENINFALYDDDSTDGSYEKLEKMVEQYDGRLILKKLKKRDIQIHPKAFAIEDAFNTVVCDYFLVIDSDSMITKTDFKKAISSMINRDIDLLHITRRSNKKTFLSEKIGEIEELMFTGFRFLKFQDSVFGGSGFFVDSSLVKDFKYDETSLSEDTYLNNQLKKRTDKIEFFLTLNSYERAPETLKSLLKQRYNWINMALPCFLEHELLQISVWNIMFIIMFVSLFNPLGIGFLLVALSSGILLGMELAMSIYVSDETLFGTFIYTLCYIFILGYCVFPIFFGIQFLIMLGKNSTKIRKNLA